MLLHRRRNFSLFSFRTHVRRPYVFHFATSHRRVVCSVRILRGDRAAMVFELWACDNAGVAAAAARIPHRGTS